MLILCFVLDLRSLSPLLLGDLKKSFLQLANLYAIAAPIGEKQRSKPLRDRIGLCYIFKNRLSCSDELKVAYSPRGNFSLRDFHHAVNNLPTDAFLPEFNDSGGLSCRDLKFSSILSNEVVYSWGGLEEDITRKVILISSVLGENLDSVMTKSLMDAAENYVSVEFVLLEQKSNQLSDVPEKTINFIKQISDLENCSFRTYFPDAEVLCGMVKRWLQELKDDMKEPLRAHFIFNSSIFGSLNRISCNLSPSIIDVVDNFNPCKTCRCHGIPLDDAKQNKTMRSFLCPVTNVDLGTRDLIENSVKIGEQTILFLPSCQNCVKLRQVSLPIDFNIIERTNLGSLSEGAILGASYTVTPSAFHESDDISESELNIQLFQGLCSTLHSFDQGLICSSKFNIETMMEASFKCYYVILPSDKGLMLLRRLAGSEEILPVPDVGQLIDSSSTKEYENSIRSSLLKLEVRDYNPLVHERGFHQKLNFLVKESLQFGSVHLNLKDMTSELNSTLIASSAEDAPSKPTLVVKVMEEEIPCIDLTAGEDQNTAQIAEEWERLIVTKVPMIYSPTCASKTKLDQPVRSPIDMNGQLDEKTSRILERLELPRHHKKKMASPVITSNCNADGYVPRKTPLIPFRPARAADVSTTASQPIKPNFQRLKRKHR